MEKVKLENRVLLLINIGSVSDDEKGGRLGNGDVCTILLGYFSTTEFYNFA